MKGIVYLFPILILAFGAETSLAANMFTPTAIMMLATNTAVELDVTMEMLDEDAESSSAIINVIDLPLQEMHQEQLRNQRRIRQESDALPLRQELGSPNAVQGEINTQRSEVQRNTREDMGQKKGH